MPGSAEGVPATGPRRPRSPTVGKWPRSSSVSEPIAGRRGPPSSGCGRSRPRARMSRRGVRGRSRSPRRATPRTARRPRRSPARCRAGRSRTRQSAGLARPTTTRITSGVTSIWSSQRPSSRASRLPRSVRVRAWSVVAEASVFECRTTNSRLILAHAVIIGRRRVLRMSEVGALFIIGGAEDKLGRRTVLRDFVEACGGSRRRHRHRADRVVARTRGRRRLRRPVRRGSGRPASAASAQRPAPRPTTRPFRLSSTMPPASS